jgi:hypothetical protein
VTNVIAVTISSPLIVLYQNGRLELLRSLFLAVIAATAAL